MYFLLGILVCMNAQLPRPGWKGGGLDFPQGRVPCLLLGLEGEWREWEGNGRRGGGGNFEWYYL